MHSNLLHQVNKEQDIAGVYALEAKVQKDKWHLVAVGYEPILGQIHFRVDDYYEPKEHIGWINASHDTMTEIRIGKLQKKSLVLLAVEHCTQSL